jgi:hypothetical protein
MGSSPPHVAPLFPKPSFFGLIHTRFRSRGAVPLVPARRCRLIAIAAPSSRPSPLTSYSFPVPRCLSIAFVIPVELEAHIYNIFPRKLSVLLSNPLCTSLTNLMSPFLVQYGYHGRLLRNEEALLVSARDGWPAAQEAPAADRTSITHSPAHSGTP